MTQATGSKQPSLQTLTNGGIPVRVVRFNPTGGPDTLQTTSAIMTTNAAYTLLVVSKRTQPTQGWEVLVGTGANNNGFALINISGKNSVYHAGGTLWQETPAATLDPSLISRLVRWRNTGVQNMRYEVDKANVVLNPTFATLVAPAAGPHFIGSLGGTAAGYSTDIAHVCVWDRALTLDELHSAEQVLYTSTGKTWAASPAVILCDGDSFTSGSGAYQGANSYPGQLAGDFPSRSVVNDGYGGMTLETMITEAPYRVDSDQYSSWRAATPGGNNVCVIHGGLNDYAAGANLATIQSRLTTYWAARRAAGWKVIACTHLPYGAGWEILRNQLNPWIRAQSALYDRLADFGADPTIGPAGAELNTMYYWDGIHLTTAGHRIMANYVRDAINAL
jgi:lysophospholipase L1-like esterase